MSGHQKATVHAMFVWQGFLTQCQSGIAWTEEDSDRYGGQIGAAMVVAEAVGILAEELDAFWNSGPDVRFPGVFDYEVSEALGGWLRTHPHGAQPDVVRFKARMLISRFFHPTPSETA